MTVETLEYCREHYNGLLMYFVEKNIDEYLGFMSADLFDIDEALQIITWNIDDSKKISLLDLTSVQISIIEKRYTDAVNAHIVANNLKPEDKPALYKRYSQYGSQTQSAITALAIAGVREIITGNMNLDDALLSVLLQSENVNRDNQITLFTKAISSLNEDTCKQHFDELDLPDLKSIFTRGGTRKKYDKSKEVTTILDAMKTCEWIYEYKQDEQNPEKYTITKSKPKDKETVLLD